MQDVSYCRVTTAQSSLRKCKDSSEPSFFAYTKMAIGTALANSVEFRGIIPRMYVGGSALIMYADVT